MADNPPFDFKRVYYEDGMGQKVLLPGFGLFYAEEDLRAQDEEISFINEDYTKYVDSKTGEFTSSFYEKTANVRCGYPLESLLDKNTGLPLYKKVNGSLVKCTSSPLESSTGFCMDESDSSFLAKSAGSFLDKSAGSFLDKSDGSFLDKSDGSFLDKSGGSFLDKSAGSFLDKSAGSFLDKSDGSFLEKSVGSFLDKSGGSFLDKSGGSFLDKSDGSFLDKSEGSFSAKSGGSLLDKSEGSFSAKSAGEFLDKSSGSSIVESTSSHLEMEASRSIFSSSAVSFLDSITSPVLEFSSCSILDVSNGTYLEASPGSVPNSSSEYSSDTGLETELLSGTPSKSLSVDELLLVLEVEPDSQSPAQSTFAPIEVAGGIPPGTICQRILPIVTNHVSAKVNLMPTGIFQYDVSICKEVVHMKKKKKITSLKPIEMSREKSKGIVKVLLPLIKEAYLEETKQKIEIAADFSKSIYTSKPILNCRIGNGKLKKSPKYQNMDYDTMIPEARFKIDMVTDTGRREEYMAIIKQAAMLDTEDVNPYLNCLAENYPSKETQDKLINLERVLNVALKTSATFNLTSVGRNSFYPDSNDPGYKIGGGLVNRTGFSLVYGLGWKNFVNVDMSNSAFYTGESVLEVLDDVFSQKRSNAKANDITTWGPRDFDKANSFLRGLKMEYFTSENKLTRKIKDVARDTATTSRFTNLETQISNTIAEYFQERYGMIVQHPNGPLLRTGNGSKVPAEFCTLKGGQAYNKRLTDSQTAAMIRDTAKTPANRMKMIESALESCKFDDDPVIKEFNLEIGHKLHRMDARVIDPPIMVYREKNGTESCSVTPTVEGSWAAPPLTTFHAPALFGQKMKWTVLNLSGKSTTKEKIRLFFANFVNVASHAGWDLGTVEDGMRGFKTFYPKDKELWTWLEDIANKVDFIFVVLADNDNPTYNAVKQFCETTPDGKRFILTQCVRGKNINTIRDSVTNNVLMKLNTKLGGINHLVEYPQKLECVDVLRDGPVMILGADVTHPSPGTKGLSLAAVTGSCDLEGLVYHSSLRAQAPNKNRQAAEIIQNLDEIVLDLLKKYVVQTRRKPRKLIFFRDGVGEGQFQAVLQKELVAIRRACEIAYAHGIYERAELDNETGDSYEPKITFVAVQKRHKTRFFCQDPANDGVGRPKNVPPGTVVDKDIVNPIHIDYYLLSHTGIQGTSKPTRYQVLWDDSEFNADELQSLTYYLCYAYARCNQSVSYPAPTYYAHLACTRAKTYTTSLNPYNAGNLGVVNSTIRRNCDLRKTFPMHFV